MTGLILDASVAVAWGLWDEASSVSAALLDRVLTGGAIAPFHFPAEVAAAVFKAHRRGRMNDSDVAALRSLLDQAPIKVDLDGGERIWSEVYPLALAEGIGLYDAIYLELAMRLDAPLATFDTALRAAAERSGLVLAC